MIRKFENKDLNRINELLKSFNYELKPSPFLHVIIYEEESIKAVLVYQLIYDRIEIDYIIVDKMYRKNGIGSELLDYLIKNNNVKNITLEVNENNIAAINLYLKYGFKVVATRKNYYKDEDGLLMLKKLGD